MQGSQVSLSAFYYKIPNVCPKENVLRLVKKGWATLTISPSSHSTPGWVKASIFSFLCSLNTRFDLLELHPIHFPSQRTFCHNYPDSAGICQGKGSKYSESVTCQSSSPNSAQYDLHFPQQPPTPTSQPCPHPHKGCKVIRLSNQHSLWLKIQNGFWART